MPEINANWWFPPEGGGTWKVQTVMERSDFGLCVNVVTGEQKPWINLKMELYGEDWLEAVTDALKAGMKA